MANGRATYEVDEAKFAALEQRVYGLERGVSDLNQVFTGRIGEVSAQLAGLSSKLDERSRTPWATIVSAMGVVLAIVVAGGQLAKAPIDNSIVRLERDTTELTKAQKEDRAASISRAEFEEFKRTYEANRANFKLDNNATLAAIRETIGDLEALVRADAKEVVPRGEHTERWRSQDAAVAGVQRQIDDLKSALGGIYGARDVILDLRERLDRTERALQDIGRRPSSP